jgi:hypothetical protein
MKKIALCILLAAFSCAIPLNAGVQDWGSTAHVKTIEMKVGNGFRFTVDQATGPCSAGTWLVFDGRFYDPSVQADMVKTVYGTVLAAKLSGQRLDLFGDNTPLSNGNCVVGIVNVDAN